MIRTDEAIRSDILTHLEWDTRVNATHINVQVRGGVVRLEGSVETALARSAAVSDASVVGGVKDVDARLLVHSPQSSPVLDDTELKLAIVNLLDADANVDPSSIAVTVEEGRVTLRGSVDSHWKRHHVEAVVSQQRRVFGIDNKLEVKPIREAADDTIARNIVRALRRHVLLTSAPLKIHVRSGRVVLSGSVPSYSARQAARDIASCTFGVTEVIDELTIEGS
jgi:osmotically-inducible protein OsmY